jgi:hypothetical protein
VLPVANLPQALAYSNVAGFKSSKTKSPINAQKSRQE